MLVQGRRKALRIAAQAPLLKFYAHQWCAYPACVSCRRRVRTLAERQLWRSQARAHLLLLAGSCLRSAMVGDVAKRGPLRRGAHLHPIAPYLQASVGHHEVGGHLSIQQSRQQAFGVSRTSSGCPRLLPIVPARVRPVAKPAPISAASLRATTTAVPSAIVPLAGPL